jgi:putative hydrolase of the HAD superfamily
MKPKAILFDAGGTLVTMHPAKFGDVVEPVSGQRPDPERMIDAHYLAMDAIGRNRHLLEGDGWWRWWLGQFLSFAGFDPSEEAVAQLAGTRGLWQSALPGARETVAAARDAGYRVAVVSNADGHVARDLEAAGFGGMFEIIVDSTVVGVSKPDPRIFGYALDALGIEAGEAWYVGDSALFDLEGARNAGLAEFVLVDPFGLHDHSPQVGDIGDLLGLLADPA